MKARILSLHEGHTPKTLPISNLARTQRPLVVGCVVGQHTRTHAVKLNELLPRGLQPSALFHSRGEDQQNRKENHQYRHLSDDPSHA